jgi:mevalonate kinase
LKNFSSKILLFGEYSILAGSMGLAIPYPAYSGKLAFVKQHDPARNHENLLQSNRQLIQLANYCLSDEEIQSFLDCERFREDAEMGLCFDSDIPQGYGLGSSGALTAAIFSKYEIKIQEKQPPGILRSRLASIEKYFHGTSSGLDPMVSLINSPVLINENREIEMSDAVPPGFLSATNAFLIDTHTKSTTGNLVQWFKQMIANEEYGKQFRQSYLPVVNRCVKAVVNNDTHEFFNLTEQLSAWQITNFAPMIPDFIKDHFEEGLSSGRFFLKLCGSGGGGYMLGFARNREELQHWVHSRQLHCHFL